MSATPASLMLEQGTYTVTITSQLPGYVFLRWQDGDTNPVKTVVLNSDVTLTAEYQPIQPTPSAPPAQNTPYQWGWESGVYRVTVPTEITDGNTKYVLDHLEET